MRLFIAVNFPPGVRAALQGAVEQLRAAADSGNFTRPENLHLTLAFLGEMEHSAPVCRAMDKVESAPFPLTFSGLGQFRREGGGLWWIGCGNQPALNQLSSTLRKELTLAGLPFDAKPFRAHLTLGREVRLPACFDSEAFSRGLAPIHAEVRSFSLMKSERIRGKLTYTELYSRRLEGAEKGDA